MDANIVWSLICFCAYATNDWDECILYMLLSRIMDNMNLYLLRMGSNKVINNLCDWPSYHNYNDIIIMSLIWKMQHVINLDLGIAQWNQETHWQRIAKRQIAFGLDKWRHSFIIGVIIDHLTSNYIVESHQKTFLDHKALKHEAYLFSVLLSRDENQNWLWNNMIHISNDIDWRNICNRTFKIISVSRHEQGLFIIYWQSYMQPISICCKYGVLSYWPGPSLPEI